VQIRTTLSLIVAAACVALVASITPALATSHTYPDQVVPATQFRAHICNGYHGHACMWADGKNGHLVRGRVRNA